MIRAIVGRVVAALGGQRPLEPGPFPGRADQPDRAEVAAAQDGVAQRGVLGVVVGHDQHVGARRQLAEDDLRQQRDVVDVDAAPPRPTAAPAARRSSCSGRVSTRCSSMSCRARMRASSSPTCPTPKIATAGTTGSGSSSTVTVPPQHCTPCSYGALSDSADLEQRRVRASGSASSSRARSIATASTLPPPIDPQVSSGADHELRAGVARGVPAHRRDRHEHARLAPCPQPGDRGEPGHVRHGSTRVLRAFGLGVAAVRVRRLRRDDVRVGDVAVRGVLSRLLDGPVDGLRGRGASRDRRWCPAGPNAAAACRSASRTEKASISGGSPTALDP